MPEDYQLIKNLNPFSCASPQRVREAEYVIDVRDSLHSTIWGVCSTGDQLLVQDNAIAALTRSANDVRDQVIQTLSSYIELSTRMRTFEELFLTQVLHPGYQLRTLIEQRERLEAECERIRSGIERGDYLNTDEIRDDVRAVLRDAARDQWYEPPEDELALPDVVEENDLNSGLDEHAQHRILREFRRIVLPKVHADTSDAPFEVFDVVHSAYKRRDYVLMESFLIQYRGELGPYHENGQAVSLRQAMERLSEYRSALRRLERRLELLKGNMTASERDDSRQARQRMEQQNQEFRRAIDEEAERLLKLRSYLESLVSDLHSRKAD
jgi:hypothetical protein